MTRRLLLAAIAATGWIALVAYWLSDPWWRGNVRGVRKGIDIGRMQLIERRMPR